MADRVGVTGGRGKLRRGRRAGRSSRSRYLWRRCRLSLLLFFRRHVRDAHGRYHAGFWAHLVARGELQVLPRRFGRRTHLSPYVELYNVGFFRLARKYLLQSILAAGAMLAVLTLVDSIADAALAAGLASSVFIVAMTPGARRADLRHLIGGHLLGLAVGVLVALILFHSLLPPLVLGPDGVSNWWVNIIAALAVGVVILMMAITDTDHPPAAATTLGFALRDLDWTLVLLFAAAVLALAGLKLLMRRWLSDLIE